MRTLLHILTIAMTGCAGASADRSDDKRTDTDDTDALVTAPCAWDDPPIAEFARNVSEGMPLDGTPVEYGNPPQGGAPYAPFEVRLHAEFDTTQRIQVSGAAADVASGVELGSVVQPQVFLCANAGPHSGWLYGGEVHVRFWDQPLESLEGRTVRVTLSIALPEGQDPVVVSTTGPLDWVLGRTAAADGPPTRD